MILALAVPRLPAGPGGVRQFDTIRRLKLPARRRGPGRASVGLGRCARQVLPVRQRLPLAAVAAWRAAARPGAAARVQA